MTSAYVLIKVEPSKAHTIYNELKKLKSVSQVDAVTGPHDIIAVIESSDVANLGRLIINDIGSLEGVRDTLTCHIIEFGQ